MTESNSKRNPNWSFLCIGPNYWGAGPSIEEAKKQMGYRPQDSVVYDVSETEGVEISELDGSISWLSASDPPVIVWMGSGFAKRNPNRAIGQSAGHGMEIDPG